MLPCMHRIHPLHFCSYPPHTGVPITLPKQMVTPSLLHTVPPHCTHNNPNMALVTSQHPQRHPILTNPHPFTHTDPHSHTVQCIFLTHPPTLTPRNTTSTSPSTSSIHGGVLWWRSQPSLAQHRGVDATASLLESRRREGGKDSQISDSQSVLS